MKHVRSTSTSANSTTTTTTMEEDERSEARDSCYYPGCRKDANCNCKYCLESINATLDLMPYSIQKSSLSKLSASRPNVESTPISFNPSILSTPTSSTPRISPFPNLKSPGKLDSRSKAERSKRDSDLSCHFLMLVIVLSLVFAAATGFSWSILKSIRPSLSADMVRNASKNSQFVQDLNGKLTFLQRELQGMVNGKISNCSYSNSMWEIDQEGMLLNSRCTLYKSATEAVSIWGWPLQTAGLLSSGFSQRSFTILSGRVTEWSDGGIGYLVRKANTSWVQKNWGASAVQLDPHTWVLEYQRSLFFDNSSLNSVTMDLFKHWISKCMRGLKNELWLPSYLENKFGDITAMHNFKIPT